MAIELDPAEVERLAGEGLAGYQIAQALGVSYDTLARRRDADAEIADALKRGQEAAIGKVENALFESALKGNLGAQVFFLKNRASDRWRDKTEQVTTLHTTPAEVLNDEFLAAVAAGGRAGAIAPQGDKAKSH
jgi:hypothetical protein